MYIVHYCIALLPVKVEKLCFICSYVQLQFLFELPSRLTKCMDMGFYSQAVKYVAQQVHALCMYVCMYNV